DGDAGEGDVDLAAVAVGGAGEAGVDGDRAAVVAGEPAAGEGDVADLDQVDRAFAGGRVEGHDAAAGVVLGEAVALDQGAVAFDEEQAVGGGLEVEVAGAVVAALAGGERVGLGSE